MGVWSPMKLQVDKTDDGQPLFRGGDVIYGLPIGHTTRELAVSMAEDMGWEDSQEIVFQIDEALQTTHEYIPHLSHAEPEHTVFGKTSLLRLLASKYAYKR